mmetsp:Transcript_43906/g.106463  ORF Transcript_43906/g.106463 Transcript_43906/m.106463 type:complete len:239 (+) Transcript_43906:245-961(+)
MVAVTANGQHPHDPLIVVATTTTTTTTTTTIDEASKDNALAHEISTSLLSLSATASTSFDSASTASTTSIDTDTQTTQQQPQRRSVSFKSTKRVYIVPSRRQLSKEERQNYYFSQEEQRKMKDEIRQWTKTIQKKAMKKRHLDDDINENVISSRGLERCTQSVFLQTKAWKHRARNLVLDHQSNGSSEEYIAALYKQSSEESCASARSRALIDQQIMIDVTGRLKDSSSPPLNIVMLR